MPTKLQLTVLAADIISQGWGRFVFDYSTLKFPERAALDYIHDDSEIIGYVENFKAAPEAVTADATLLDESPNGRAAEIAFNLANGVPYEASAFIDLEGSTETEVHEGAVLEVNGRELHGPFTLYSGATMRGCAVCPHGADALARTALALSADSNKKGNIMTLNTNLNGDAVKLSEPPTPQADEATAKTDKTSAEADKTTTPEPEDAVRLALPQELSAMVDEFGAEKGLEFYRRGLSFKDAKLENYSRRVAELESKNGALLQQVKDLESKVAELSAARRGDPLGVPESAPEREPKHDADPLMALAAKYKKNGSVRI